MKYSDEQRIEKILAYATKLQKYILENNVSKEKILNDFALQWLVTTPLYNIGEHVHNLSKEYKSAHEEIQWNMISGLRHRLVHDYEGTNWNIIVDVIFDELPDFIEQLKNCSRLKLPQCEIFYPAQIGQEFLFVAGGRRPSDEFFIEVSRDRKVFAVDKGIEICRDLNILPEILIGDFDSAESLAVNWAIENKIPIERHPVDKDFTDTQLALNLVDEKSFVVLTGIFGGRFDHLFSNVFTCASAKINTCLADEREVIFFVHGGESFTVKFFVRPMALSLLPITEICEGVTLKNTHWELENATLKQNFPNAVSNRVEADTIKISATKGTLAVYLGFSC